jgi:uncharacterized protein (TIGR02118 family)
VEPTTVSRSTAFRVHAEVTGRTADCEDAPDADPRRSMVIKMAVFYRTPDDPDAFEKKYIEEHLPMVRGYDNVSKTSAYKVTRRIAGEFPYAYVFTGTWADKDGWKADMNSQAAKDATAHAMSFAPPFDVVVLESLE